jgi:hypothetical protein
VLSCGVIRYDVVYYNSFQLARSRLVTALVSVSIVTGGGGDDDDGSGDGSGDGRGDEGGWVSE